MSRLISRATKKGLRSMKVKFKRFACAVAAMSMVAAFGLAGCSGGNSASSASSSAQTEAADTVQLQVFAANSLSMAMPEAMETYTELYPEITFTDAQYLASDDLNAQLEGGAPCDIEITASKATMDTAVEKGLVDESTRVDMFGNDLVIIAKADSDIAKNADKAPVTLKDIADKKYTVSIGDENVPAGNYARQSLSTVGAFKATGDDAGKTGSEISGKEGEYVGIDPQLAAKVGDVANYVSTGDVQTGFVYTSDIYRFDGVANVGIVPADTHKPIVYPGAITSNAQHPEEAQAFLNWCLEDPAAQAIWQKWGFDLI